MNVTSWEHFVLMALRREPHPFMSWLALKAGDKIALGELECESAGKDPSDTCRWNIVLEMKAIKRLQCWHVRIL